MDTQGQTNRRRHVRSRGESLNSDKRCVEPSTLEARMGQFRPTDNVCAMATHVTGYKQTSHHFGSARSFVLIWGLSYNTTFSKELWIFNLPLLDIAQP